MVYRYLLLNIKWLDKFYKIHKIKTKINYRIAKSFDWKTEDMKRISPYEYKEWYFIQIVSTKLQRATLLFTLCDSIQSIVTKFYPGTLFLLKEKLSKYSLCVGLRASYVRIKRWNTNTVTLWNLLHSIQNQVEINMIKEE